MNLSHKLYCLIIKLNIIFMLIIIKAVFVEKLYVDIVQKQIGCKNRELAIYAI